MKAHALLEQALIGTAKEGAEPPLAPGLREIAAALPASLDSSRKLLLGAGLDAIYSMAGYAPQRLELPSPAEDLRPAPSRRAETVLGEILALGQKGLLFAALERVDQAGMRWPAGLLPALLDLGRKSFVGRRELLARVLDARGPWLAVQKAEWNWALTGVGESAAEGEDALWTGAIDERVAAWTRWREREPAAARASLEAAFEKEKAEARAALLVALRAGIGADDGVFVEKCLRDRSQAVREVAMELLLHLPESDASRRAAERVFAQLRLEEPSGGGLISNLAAKLGGKRASVLSVELPDEAPKEWQEDGIALKPPAGVGAKAFWLAQLVAAVPPRLFCRRWSLEPAELVAVCASHTWSESLLLGLARSAAALADVELAILLIPALGNICNNIAVVSHQAALFGSLPPAEKLRQCTLWLEKGFSGGIEIRAESLPAQIESEAGRLFRDALQRAVNAYPQKNDGTFLRFLLAAATALPLDLAAGLELPDLSAIDRLRYAYQGPRERYLEIVRLRQRLAQELPL